MGHIH
ncbi:unnamed protein product, partial [Didymodactylos carnosus]